MASGSNKKPEFEIKDKGNNVYEAGIVRVVRRRAGVWDIYVNGKLVGTKEGVASGKELLRQQWEKYVLRAWEKEQKNKNNQNTQPPAQQPPAQQPPAQQPPNQETGTGGGTSGGGTGTGNTGTGTGSSGTGTSGTGTGTSGASSGFGDWDSSSDLIDEEGLNLFKPDKINTATERILRSIENFYKETQEGALNTAFWNIFFQNANFSNPYFETKLLRDPETGQFTVRSEYNPAVQRAFEALYEQSPRLEQVVEQGIQAALQPMPQTAQELQQYATPLTERDFKNMLAQQQNWDVTLTPEDIDYLGTVQDRKTVESELFNLYTQDIESDFQKRKQELANRLANEGISPYSRRYLEAMTELEKEKNRAIMEARQRAVADSGTEMLRRLQGQLNVAQERFGQRSTIQGLQRQRALDTFSQQSDLERLRQNLLNMSMQEDELRNRAINDAFSRLYQNRLMQLDAGQRAFQELKSLVPAIDQQFVGTQKPHVDLVDIWRAWTNRDLQKEMLKKADSPFVPRIMGGGA